MADLRPGVALALSGGGFRATLFHAGALIRINECGLLPTLTRVSSVSGGAIAAGRLAVTWSRLHFDERGVARNLQAEVISPLQSFCRQDVDKRAVRAGTLSPFSSIGNALEEIYSDDLLEGVGLQGTPSEPRFVFNATNLRTGRLVRIAKDYLADYRIGAARNPDIPLARAVAASSAFPPVLSPVIIDGSALNWERVDGADLHDDPSQRDELQLTDGGVYDNLGLEVVSDFETLLVSDAGAPFALTGDDGVGWLKQPMRALDIATDQSRALRKRWLFERKERIGQKVAFWAVDTAIGDYGLADALPTSAAIVGPLARLRTRLNPFSHEEQGRLINWGYALADAALRRHLRIAPSSPQWPAPAHSLDAEPG